jgi:predicted amidohydrolase YtcJ
MKKYILLFAILIIAKQQSSAQADIILVNGKIFTSDTAQLYVQALAIKGNKILAIGSNTDIETLVSGHTKRIDLDGKTVVPGFNDAHDHAGWGAPIGKSFLYTEMNPVGLSKAAVLDSVARLVKLAKPNEWITGLIGTSVLFDTSMRTALDSIVPNNPVALQIWWGHGLVVNGKALSVSGISDSDKDPVGGWYLRNSTNKINALQENAQAPVWFTLSNSEPDNLIEGMQAYAQLQLKSGITTIQYMGTGFKEKEVSRILQKSNISQRIRIVAWPLSTFNGRVLSEWKHDNAHPTVLTSISGIKYLIDGTPLEQNSLFKKPYSEGGTWYGHLDYPVDTIKQFLKEALTTNRQLMMHITGDSSMAIVLSLMKQLANGDVWKSKRVRIEHNQTPYITPFEVNDVKELGLVMMHTPKYCQGSPIQSFIEKGITMGISPDGTTNPFWDIMVITTQQTNPAENITREQAVIAYTKTNAYAEFAENKKGTLAKGMLADLAVLSQDIFTIPAEQLTATKSILTIVDGKIVYQQRGK